MYFENFRIICEIIFQTIFYQVEKALSSQKYERTLNISDAVF